MDLSIIVVTYLRPALLRECLHSIGAADRANMAVEVIVVDDGGGLDPEIEQTTVLPDIPVRWVYLPENRGQPAAQHAGMAAAQGDTLAFLDDDAVIDPGWITAIRDFFTRHPTISAMLGRIQPRNTAHILVRMRQQVYERRHRKYLQPEHTARLQKRYGLTNDSGAPLSDHVSGGNCAIRRAALDAVGGIAHHLRRGADGILSEKLLRAGYAIGYNPAMVIYHAHNESYRVMYRQGFGEGRAKARQAREAGTGRTGVVRQAFMALWSAPVQIRRFRELWTTDPSRIKVYAIYTTFCAVIALGQIYEAGRVLFERRRPR